MTNQENNAGNEELPSSKYEVVVKWSSKEETIKDRKDLKKEKLTTYMLSVYRDVLKEMSEETGVSMTKLINQAVDEFLQDIGKIDGTLTPPVDKNYFRSDENVEESQEEGINEEVKESLAFFEERGDVKFSLSQAHDLTGIKKGRIQYWTDSGHIKDLVESDEGRYRYTPRELRKIELIDKFYKTGDKEGFPLETAARKAEEFLNIKNDIGAKAELLIIQRHLEDRIDVLAEKFVEAGLASKIIDVLNKEEK